MRDIPGSKVVVIDDDSRSLAALSAVITELHPETTVLCASSGQEGIDLARRENPDVILLDVVMPGMDGFEVCRRLSASAATQTIPIIFLTALSADDESRRRALELGADGFLVKPANPAELSAHIRAMTRLKRANQLQTKSKHELAELVAERTQQLEQQLRRQALSESQLLQAHALVRRENTRFEAVNELLRDSIACQEASDAAAVCLRIAQRITQSAFGCIVELSETDQFTTLAASTTRPPSKTPDKCDCGAASESVIRGIWNAALASEKGVIRNAPPLDSNASQSPLASSGLQRTLAMPLRHATYRGVMLLANKEQGYTESDRDPVEALALAVTEVLQGKRAEKKLRESQEYLRTVFAAADNVAFITTDLGGKDSTISGFSPGAERIFGYKAEEVLGQKVAMLHPLGADDAFAALQEALVAGGNADTDEFTLVRKSGEHFPAMFTIHPLRNDSGHVTGTLGVSIDISERRHLQAQVTRSDRLASLGMLAAGVAHEINNPLTYLLYNLESAIEDWPALAQACEHWRGRLKATLGPEDWQVLRDSLPMALDTAMLDDMGKRFTDALMGAERIKSIAQGLSTFSRADQPHPEKVNLTNILKAAVTMVFNEIKYRAQLLQDYGDAPAVMANDGQLSQVFVNLLINATHAIAEGDVGGNQISIRTYGSANEAVVEIRDTGAGISQDHLDHLFEPFFTTKAVGNGTGLGLAISKNIIESYDGTIEVTSEPGHGTAFVVRLPGCRKVDTAYSGLGEATDGSHRAQGRVLVIDDEAPLRAAVARILKTHEVVQAVSGADAQRLLESDQAFDVILCDMMMPTISGAEFHAWLAHAHPDLADRTVFVTGGAFTPHARDYLATVKNVRLEKPFNAAYFRQVVGKLVSQAHH